MLPIDLGALRQGPVDMAQVVPTGDPALEKLEFELGEPVQLSGRLMDAGSGRFYWHGGLKTRVRTACRRCLAAVDVPVSESLEVLFTEDPTADDAAAYGIEPGLKELDPGAAVREELILAVPEYVLCGDNCRGICPSCGMDLNDGTCECRAEVDQRWSQLQEFRTELTDQEAD